jgi:hypothetical protein
LPFPLPPALCAFADATLAHLPIALSGQLIDFGQHPGQQRLGRYRAYPGPLEGSDVLPLAVDLPAHVLNFGSDLGKLHGPDLVGLIRTKSERYGKPLGIARREAHTPNRGTHSRRINHAQRRFGFELRVDYSRNRNVLLTNRMPNRLGRSSTFVF